MNDSRYACTIPKSHLKDSWHALGHSPRNSLRNSLRNSPRNSLRNSRNSPMMGGRHYESPIKCAHVQQPNGHSRCIKTDDGEHDHLRCEVNDTTGRCRLSKSKVQTKPSTAPFVDAGHTHAHALPESTSTQSSDSIAFTPLDIENAHCTLQGEKMRPTFKSYSSAFHLCGLNNNRLIESVDVR